MLSKNKISKINQLKRKKYRDIERCFIAEGEKLIEELCKKYRCRWLVYTADYENLASTVCAEELLLTTAEEVQKVSLLEASQGVFAVFYYSDDIEPLIPQAELTIVADGIQNAGNLGTIIRIADWFGIRNIFLSEESVDPYNPKVVQATMGAMARVNVQKTNIIPLLSQNNHLPIYGAVLGGDDLHTCELSQHGVIILGNEGNGISDEVLQYVNKRITIPPYPVGVETSESLNVAIAAAILCYEFRRIAR